MNITLKIAIIAFTALTSITSVSCSEKTYSKYQCPMKCEAEKTYDKPGNCPVCEMELKGIE